MKIALDAMGHDEGPAKLVEGAALALREFPEITKLFLTGDARRLEGELTRIGCSDGRVEIVHCTQVVEMTDDAAFAVRRKKDSSVSRAVDLVKEGRAEAIVSAGHTGACVTAAKVKLRTLTGIERPGIAATMPTQSNLFVLIDAGANTDPTPRQMLENAIMGSVYSRHVLGYQNPRVGLMSIGTEDEKGNEFTRDTFEMLKASSLNFRGNVEGHDLFEHPVEVVVADGFTGNIVLKTSEAIAHAIFAWLKTEIYKNPVRKLGALLAKPAFKAIHQKTSAEAYGGMPLLGVNGVCIIAHGGSSPVAIKNAIRMAAESIRHQVNPHIIEEVQRHHDSTQAAHTHASA
ncbi:MAG: phosphate acyltransferase [Chthoniobacter sp.]|jgi:glycerol-3-phosphate acyltransferase PlsX|nr:phosphate acyltransferase [Chthoniobacter sp.]